MIQASGQASWADLVWIKTSKYTKGQHITSSSSVSCRQLYSGVCFIAPWGADIAYHDLFRVSVPYGTIVDCINEQFIICGCYLSVACSVDSGYSCHIGLDTIESYLILRVVVLAYSYGICFTTPARAVVVVPRWAYGLPML